MSEKHAEQVIELSEYWKLINKSRSNTRNISKWKNEHLGILPKDVWLKTLEAGGSYSCVEMIPFDPKTGTVYLKRRSDPTATGGEKEWEGKLHIPGIVELTTIRGEDVLSKLLSKEILKDKNNVDRVKNSAKILTQVIYPEPERKTVANTLVLTLPIEPDLLANDFSPVSQKDIDLVIDQHRPLLKAYWNGTVPPIFDLRQK